MSHLHLVICLKMPCYTPHNCISKKNQSVVKLFLNTDLENEMGGSKLVAN